MKNKEIVYICEIILNWLDQLRFELRRVNSDEMIHLGLDLIERTIRVIKQNYDDN